MTLVELDRALRKLRLSGIADVLETRLRHAQAERLAAARSRGDARQRRTAATGRPARGAPPQTGRASATPTARWRILISTSTRR